jgi:ATP-dependent protease ClpP protease subunit
MEKEHEHEVNEYCRIIKTTKQANIYNIYLTAEISDAHNYVSALGVINDADDDDSIILHLNSYGGNLWTALQFINTIGNCNATIIASAEGQIHSAASLIFLSAPQWVVHTNTAMLCHWFSSAECGKGQEIRASVEFHDKYFKDLYRRLYKDFLTAEELENMFNGQDLWLHGEDIVRRMKRINAANMKRVKLEVESKGK